MNINKVLACVVMIASVVLSGCRTMTEVHKLDYRVTKNQPDKLQVGQPVGPNEGLLYLSLNSEIHKNVITFVNVETGQLFRTDTMVGRYHKMLIKLPAGQYRWQSVKLNRGFFKSNSKDDTPHFEILAGKLNYPGDMDIIIWSRENETVRVAYIDRENRIATSLLELENYEFHYSRYVDE